MPKSVITTSPAATATAQQAAGIAAAAPAVAVAASGGEEKVCELTGAAVPLKPGADFGSGRGGMGLCEACFGVGFGGSLGADVTASPFAVRLPLTEGSWGLTTRGGLGTTALRHLECGASTPW